MNIKNKILITGGLGYIGIELVKYLSKNNKIIVCDTGFFFKKRIKLKNVKILKKDFRDLKIKEINGCKIVIHLAAISNDPSVTLNPKLSWDTNVLGLKLILDLCKKIKIKKFIFASSGSVYGYSKEKKVHENLDLVPISEYNKTKMVGERVVLSYQKDFITSILRPATVCGLSDSMRYDLTVNLLTINALTKKSIKIFGGAQFRPNIHIKDMIRVYDFFIKKNLPGIYNAGFENFSINNIYKLILKFLKTKINVKILPSNDPRSYRLDSSKLIKEGFFPLYKVKDAIKEIILKNKKTKLFIKKENIRVDHLKRIL
jgi:nucleoside-diphosphate-sugar epimerase